MTKQFILASTALLAAAICRGEAQRTTTTLENKFPELGHIELGAVLRNTQFDDVGSSKLSTFGPYARLGLLPQLTAYAEVPAAVSDTNFGDDGAGLGDIKLGLQLLAYEDIFTYPWVIPHADVTLPTGDENKGLGYGEGTYGFGISVGTRMYDKYSFVVDGSYVLNGGFASGSRAGLDATILGFGFVADVSEKLAFVAEGKLVFNDDNNADNATATTDDPMYFAGGMVYRPTERITLGATVGGWVDSESESELSIRASIDL